MSDRLAIKGGAPLRKKRFHTWPQYEESDLDRLKNVLMSEQWGGSSSYVRDFEKAFARRCGTADAVTVSNGTVSLLLCLRAIGIKPGDEVIVPGLTWIATATAVLEANGVPVMVDVEADTSCIDPAAIEAAITPRTVAIIPVYLYGCMADMDAIGHIAEQHGLAVIEDCAHAHGAEWRGKSAGSIGALGSFSFQMSKVMTAGEGGAIIGHDQVLLGKIHSLRDCGRHGPERGVAMLGGNHRITGWQAAILLGQLQKLDSQLARREKNLTLLKQLLSDVSALSVFEEQEHVTKRPWYRLGLHYDSHAANGIPLSDFIKAVGAEGVPVERCYATVYTNSLYHTDNLTWYPETLRRYNCPVAESLVHEKVVNLPHELFLGPAEDMEDIVRAFKKVLAKPDEATNLKSRAKEGIKGIMRKIR